MSNTALWEQVFVTDPQAVKPITGKSYRGNSPKPYWLIERATQTFGPVGIGWGVIVESERFERLSDTDVLHVAVVSVWYVWDGKRSETFSQMGGTKAAYMTSKGVLMVDEDAGKKSVTDGMVKCLSMIGFAGDIFTGQWDDSKYVEWANEQYHPTKKPAPVIPATPSTESLGLSKDELDFISDMAEQVRELVASDATAALNLINAAGLEGEQRIALSNMLDTKTRSALKKAKELQPA